MRRNLMETSDPSWRGTILLGLPAGVVRGVAVLFAGMAVLFLVLAVAVPGHVAQPPPAVIRPPEAGGIGPGAGRSTAEAAVPHESTPEAAVPLLRCAVVLARGQWTMDISWPNKLPARPQPQMTAAAQVSGPPDAVTIACDGAYTLGAVHPHKIREQYEFAGAIVEGSLEGTLEGRHGARFTGRSRTFARFSEGVPADGHDGPFDLTLDIAANGRSASGLLTSAAGVTRAVRMTFDGGPAGPTTAPASSVDGEVAGQPGRGANHPIAAAATADARSTTAYWVLFALCLAVAVAMLALSCVRKPLDGIGREG